MDVIANDLERFGQDITDYNQMLTRLDADQISLLTHMNELQNMWEGEAHNQFMETFNKDYEIVLQMVEFLKELHGDMTYADTEYTECESSVGNIIENMNV